jgi:hypothetical protein
MAKRKPPLRITFIPPGPRYVSFADWCATPRPRMLGLNQEHVAQICRAMRRPEARGVSSSETFSESLHHLKVLHDKTSWANLHMTARALWVAFREQRKGADKGGDT